MSHCSDVERVIVYNSGARWKLINACIMVHLLIYCGNWVIDSETSVSFMTFVGNGCRAVFINLVTFIHNI